MQSRKYKQCIKQSEYKIGNHSNKSVSAEIAEPIWQ